MLSKGLLLFLILIRYLIVVLAITFLIIFFLFVIGITLQSITGSQRKFI